MKKLFWLLLLCALPCSGATIKLFTDYPNSTPVSSDFMLFQRNGTYFSSAQSQFLPVWFTDPVFTGNGSINGAFNVGGTLTVGGAVITGVTYYGDGAGLSNVASQVYLKNLNDNGTNETFWSSTFNGTNVFQEIDSGTAYFTNFYTFITNAPFLNTDGDGKVTVGVFISGTNLLLSAGDNITFATNSGTITIASAATNTVNTITNSLFVTTNVIIYSNLTVLQNIYATTNFSTNFYSSISYITNLYTSIAYITNLNVSQGFITNLYASTNFTTNLFFQSGKGNTLIITNNLNLNYLSASKLVATDGAKNLTNADVAARFSFSGNVLDLASVVTAGSSTKPAFDIYGRVTSSGTATLASSDFANQGTTTTVLHGNAAGNPSWAAVANADLANSSITIQGSAVALGGSTLAAGSTPIFDLSSSTNLIYRYTTNAITALALTFGKSYTTNLSANITITAVNSQDVAAYETCIISVTNSSGTDWKVTLPSGITGTPGSGTPPAFYCTNKLSCDIFVAHYGNQKTNAWKIDWAP